MARSWRLALLLTVLAVALAWVGYWSAYQSFGVGQRDTKNDPQLIDFYVENIKSWRFSNEGALVYRLSAIQLEHVQSSDLTRVQQPQMVLYKAQAAPWQINSGRGEVLSGGQQVELLDGVRLKRLDDTAAPTVVESTQLTVFPEREYARTDAPVRIETAGGVTTAVGMEAFFKDSRVLLHSKVRGQHEIR